MEEEEEEIYEVINVHKLKSATPNLRVINLYGINFVDDSHIDAFSSNCIQLECLAVNFCAKVTGSTMKTLFQRSRRLKCLLMQGTSKILLCQIIISFSIGVNLKEIQRIFYRSPE